MAEPEPVPEGNEVDSPPETSHGIPKVSAFVDFKKCFPSLHNPDGTWKTYPPPPDTRDPEQVTVDTLLMRMDLFNLKIDQLECRVIGVADLVKIAYPPPPDTRDPAQVTRERNQASLEYLNMRMDALFLMLERMASKIGVIHHTVEKATGREPFF